jgi:signal peptidase II
VTSQSLRWLLLLFLSGGIIALDQATKIHVMQTMQLHESIIVIPDFLSLTYIRNPGAAFGILASSSSGFRLLFFGLTSVFALGLLGTILYRLPEQDWAGRLSVAAIFGGAVGNLIDRMSMGEVVDFLDVYVGRYHWPAFNVADSAISVGVVVLMLHFAFEKNPPEPAVPHPGTSS